MGKLTWIVKRRLPPQPGHYKEGHSRWPSSQRKRPKTGYKEGRFWSSGFPHPSREKGTVGDSSLTRSNASAKNKQLLPAVPLPRTRFVSAEKMVPYWYIPFRRNAKKKGYPVGTATPAEAAVWRAVGMGVTTQGQLRQRHSNFLNIKQEVVAVLHHNTTARKSITQRSGEFLGTPVSDYHSRQQQAMNNGGDWHQIRFWSVPTIQNSFVTESVRQAAGTFKKSN